jgi:hypothetical protein
MPNNYQLGWIRETLNNMLHQSKLLGELNFGRVDFWRAAPNPKPNRAFIHYYCPSSAPILSNMMYLHIACTLNSVHRHSAVVFLFVGPVFDQSPIMNGHFGMTRQICYDNSAERHPNKFVNLALYKGFIRKEEWKENAFPNFHKILLF